MTGRLVCAAILTILWIPSPAPGQGNFLRGDANSDREIDISDAVFTLLHLFVGTREPLCLDALDFDDGGSIEVTDAIGLLRYLVTAGDPPSAPYPIFDADPTPDDELSCLPEVPGPVSTGGSELSGDITENVVLTADKSYRLISGVYVKRGVTLTIEPGVTILGDRSTESFLAVERGARILAVGTETHPIVFTSERPVGERERGDWGGILICGEAPANVAGGEWVVKGFEDLMAGGGDDPDPADSSGRMSYVRIEYSGGEVFGATLSAISFCAVGSETRLDHIQSKYGDDDGIEWYGGTCSLRYGMSIGMADDGFDCEYGWQGRAQFLVCLQDPEAGNHGFQVAEDSGQPEAEPLTLPTLANVSIIGAWEEGSRSGYGVPVRRFAGIRLYNAIIEGWRQGGIEFGSDYGEVTLDRCVFFDNDETCSGSGSACAALFEAPFQNLEASEPVTVDPDDLEDPDLRGIPSALPAPLDPTEIDEWFAPGSHVGAVPPEGDGPDWTHERWISWMRD